MLLIMVGDNGCKKIFQTPLLRLPVLQEPMIPYIQHINTGRNPDLKEYYINRQLVLEFCAFRKVWSR